ncbi:hypothetical protein [Rhizobium grahamii]
MAAGDAVFGAQDDLALLYQYRAKWFVAVCRRGYRGRNRLAQKRLPIFHEPPQELRGMIFPRIGGISMGRKSDPRSVIWIATTVIFCSKQ